ncbi:hypothetical protein ELH72_35885 [Rhizobium ruizarguesonis]|jgi:hypothetical protein|uniref:hypothetical protein n=1 Tax=Rhizobium ruizarguesonis TaxID=2081791 RepID=UPI0010308078|nr:hypothetical protein [Rhizobium ruizarguesonis]TAZ68041.1 hypothetical protein ELH72_35885 [Rhizobium ruizarguesonis]
MTYVASPSYHREDANRASNLRQCLETARRHPDETSQAPETGKIETLVTSDIEAGWDENEVREALSASDKQNVTRPKQEPPVPTMGVVPSSSF